MYKMIIFDLKKNIIRSEGEYDMMRILGILFMCFLLFTNAVFATVNHSKSTKKVALKKAYAIVPIPKVDYLTFDDGPSKFTDQLLDILKQEHVKATFFVTYHPLKGNDARYKRILSEGHVLGNHTASHNYAKIYKNINTFSKDVEFMQRYLQSLGVKTKLLRFPGGSNNPQGNKAGGKGAMSQYTKWATSQGYTYYDWNIEDNDAVLKHPTKEQLVDVYQSEITRYSNPLILMHDTRLVNIQAATLIIQDLKSRGFTFDTLDHAPGVVQFQDHKYQLK